MPPPRLKATFTCFIRQNSFTCFRNTACNSIADSPTGSWGILLSDQNIINLRFCHMEGKNYTLRVSKTLNPISLLESFLTIVIPLRLNAGDEKQRLTNPTGFKIYEF